MRKFLSLMMAVMFSASMAFAAVVSGTTYNTKSATNFAADWTYAGAFSTSGGGFIQLIAPESYVQTDEFCQGGFTSVTVKARKFGGPDATQGAISVDWWENGAETPVTLGTVSPSSTTLSNLTISTPASVTANKKGYIKISCKGASNSKGCGVSEVTISYTDGDCSTTPDPDPQPTTQDLYLKLSSDWAGWPAKYAVYYFNDTENGWSEFMTAVTGEENTYTATIPVGFSKVIFVRFNSEKTATGNWDDKWSQTVDLTIPEGKNHFTVTSGGTGSECDGTWGVYPVVPTYYVKGTFDEWGDGHEMTEGTYTFENLAAGTYQIKVVDDANNWLGYEKLDVTQSSAHVYSQGNDKNIKFTLAEAGNVTVAYDGTSIVVTGTFVAPTTKFTVTVPEGTENVYIAGNFNNWAFAQMTLKAGEEDVFELTVSEVESDTVAYKYLAGTDWKFEEVIENNRSYNAADEVSAWKAIPTIYKYAKVKEAPINWTGHYIIAFADHKPHSVISGSDLAVDAKAAAFTDGDTISIMEGNDFAVDIRFSETAGAYTVKLPNGKYIKIPGSNAVNEDEAAMALYMGFYESENQEGVRIADKADLSSTGTRMIYNNSSYYRSYTNKIDNASYKLPTLYRLVDEAFDCQDGPYALLVNGTDVIPAKMEEKEGYNEYAMYASLVKGDSVQVLNTSCGGLWIPTLEEAGAAEHFAKGVAAATVDSTGCYDFYFKQIPNDQKMYIGFGICADDTIRYTVRGKGGILGEDFENAFDSKQDTLPLALAAGKYELKVVVGEDWKGFEQLTDTANGLTVGEMDNICFTLKEAGTVQVVYNDTVFKLIGNFYVPVPHYYLVGSMNNWKVGENEFIAGNEDSLSIELPLYGDYNYQFKVVEVIDTDTTWYGLQLGEGQDWAPMVYGNCTGWWLDTKIGETDALNVKLLTTKAGKYTFIYEANEHHEISVVIPEPAPAVPETKIAMLDGIFSIAKDAHAQFARGNLQYNYATQTWFTAEKQYDFLGEDPNLHFGDENYVGSIDLFGYSNEKSNYGLLVSNKDADFVGGGAFQDWGNLFEGGEYSSLSTKEWQYLLARKDEANNKLWTIIALTPTANSDDDIYGLVLFPDNWVKPEGLNFTYGFYNLDDDETLAGNTFTLEQWETFEEAGAVFLPMAGSRAGHIGCTNKGKEETTVVNPKVGWYCWVDNIGWYGYYWNSTMSATNDTVADYLIFPGWSEGPTLADDDDIWLAPQVWSREKRRGNSVRLVHKTYDPHYYLAGTMTNWKADSIALLPLESYDDVFGAMLNLKADSLYEYKVVRVQGPETTWYGLGQMATMEFGDCEGWYVYPSVGEENQANVGLQTTKEGEYPFILKVAEDHLEVSVAIPARYYAKYSVGETWEWSMMTEKEGKWIADSVIYRGGGANIYFKEDNEHAWYFNESGEDALKAINAYEGFAALDTVQFSFNPVDTTLTAILIGKYVEPTFYIAGNMTGWNDNKIPVYGNSHTLELEAGKYQLKVVDGEWLGIDALTTVADYLYKDQDGNICFVLAGAGNVTVDYVAGELFTVTGEFIDPAVKLIGINGWEPAETCAIALIPAEDHMTASATLNLSEWYYEFKVIIAEAWVGKAHGEEEGKYMIKNDWNWVDGLTYDGDNLVLSMGEGDQVPGDYIFTYEYATGKLTVTFPEAPAVLPQYGILLNGEFLPAEKNDEYTGEGEEWVVNTTMHIDDEFQIYDNANKVGWIMAIDEFGYNEFNINTEEQKYIVTANGTYALYIRLIYGADKLYVEYTAEGTDIDNLDTNAPAVKILRDGQILIIKGTKTFNIQGQLVR